MNEYDSLRRANSVHVSWLPQTINDYFENEWTSILYYNVEEYIEDHERSQADNRNAKTFARKHESPHSDQLVTQTLQTLVHQNKHSRIENLVKRANI